MSTRICPFHKSEVVKEECPMCVKEDGQIAAIAKLKRERDFLLFTCQELYKMLGPEPDERVEDLLYRAIQFAEKP